MNKKVIRTPVYVGSNRAEGVHEITASYPATKRINLVQDEVWVVGTVIQVHQRSVWIDTDKCYKRYDELPGNIVYGLTEEQICQDPTQNMLYDENEQIVTNQKGQPLYGFYYYCSSCPYQPYGELELDDQLPVKLS